ncbi:cupin domain-containing protein [Sphingomonas cannabina]|uniref:1,2-dihydroxy-3-keto-5-methylthiopentene dioxygenase n=1 Tax=Sphingomonas cannabina TaxID=2899123 RepID=UPI001F34AF3C|nr:cupin domain-containing protein [Sphingomonas cannabina]UIJ47167.1 cupin domain-containing protein [Sphingomonas cannabina]
MTRLRRYDEQDGASPELDTEDPAVIADALATIGARFERWPLRAVATDASDADVLATYAPEIDRLRAEGGYQSVDIVRMRPDHPDRAALRTKFLDEHRHSEDEVRFFVEGEGLFTLHEGGKVHALLCTAGDLISVPAGMRHWFDMGPAPRFAAIRLFINSDGWVAQMTGDDIASHFPRHEPVAA